MGLKKTRFLRRKGFTGAGEERGRNPMAAITTLGESCGQDVGILEKETFCRGVV